MPTERETAKFYDQLWPTNLPDFATTKKYIFSLLPKSKRFENGLDAGCGPGITSVALAERCESLWAIDISQRSLASAKKIAQRFKKNNISFKTASVLKLSFKNRSFDLVFCWGVINHTKEPSLAISELSRVLKQGGILVLAVYQKTWLTPLHELIRAFCINLPKNGQKALLFILTMLVTLFIASFARREPKRGGVKISTLVWDWYFVPEKHFFSKDELNDIFKKNRLSYEIIDEQNGRFKSTSNLVIIGKK